MAKYKEITPSQRVEDRLPWFLCSIAFADPADLFDQDGRLHRIQDLPPHVRAAVASVETVRGGGIKVKLWNKNVALGDLGRWRRMFVELQERGKVGEFDHQTNEELRADIEMLQAITKAKRSAKESSDS